MLRIQSAADIRTRYIYAITVWQTTIPSPVYTLNQKKSQALHIIAVTTALLRDRHTHEAVTWAKVN